MIDRVEKLVAHYQKALLINPANANIHNELGNLYTFQGKYENATYHHIKSIQCDPSCFQAYWKLKFSLMGLNWFRTTVDLNLLNQGIEILKDAAQNQPSFPFAYAVLGDLLTQKGDKQEAIDCYRMASEKQILLSHPELISQSRNLHQQSRPNFLILGSMRCGTTSLYDYLITHPKILPAVDKELWFFTNFFDQGIDWYLAHFPEMADGVNYLTGEATPLYLNFPNAATKILDSFPNIKFIILLRNPVERAVSAIYLGRPPSLKNIQLEANIIDGLEQAKLMLNNSSDISLIEPFSIVNCGLSHQSTISFSHLLNGLYIFYLKRWLTIFPRDQFLILKSEDFFSDPSTTMKEVHSFLNISNYQLPKFYNRNPGSYPLISDDLRQQLTEFYQPYNQQLEDYLNIKFNWE